MKNPFIFLILIFLINSTLPAQNIIGVVDYMKVENQAEYLEVEQLWQKIHEERIKQNNIIGWVVCQVMFNAVEDPYNFVTISWYDSFSKLDKGIPEEILEAAYPEKTADDWKTFMERTDKSRIKLTSGVFHQRLSTNSNLDLEGKYYVINEISVKPGKSREYLKMEEAIYMPLHKLAIKNNNRTGWSLWAKWPGHGKNFQYLSADGYTNLDQIDEVDYVDYFNQIHPDKELDQISEKMEELRTLVNSEMWKIMYKSQK